MPQLFSFNSVGPPPAFVEPKGGLKNPFEKPDTSSQPFFGAPRRAGSKNEGFTSKHTPRRLHGFTHNSSWLQQSLGDKLLRGIFCRLCRPRITQAPGPTGRRNLTACIVRNSTYLVLCCPLGNCGFANRCRIPRCESGNGCIYPYTEAEDNSYR